MHMSQWACIMTGRWVKSLNGTPRGQRGMKQKAVKKPVIKKIVNSNSQIKTGAKLRSIFHCLFCDADDLCIVCTCAHTCRLLCCFSLLSFLLFFLIQPICLYTLYCKFSLYWEQGHQKRAYRHCEWYWPGNQQWVWRKTDSGCGSDWCFDQSWKQWRPLARFWRSCYRLASTATDLPSTCRLLSFLLLLMIMKLIKCVLRLSRSFHDQRRQTPIIPLKFCRDSVCVSLMISIVS